MNPGTILSIIMAVAPMLPQLASSLSGAAPGLANLLQLLHPATTAQPGNIVELVQTALNEAQSIGYINFGKPLVVDGKFGGATFGAIKALQAKLGITVQEPLASMEMEILAAVFAKL